MKMHLLKINQLPIRDLIPDSEDYVMLSIERYGDVRNG